MSDYENSRQNWLRAKENYDNIVKLYEDIYKMVQQSHETLDAAWEEFNNKRKTDNVVTLKKGE